MELNWNLLSKYRNQLYGLSIVWIVVFHVFETYSTKLNFNWTSAFILSSGNIGVDVFLFLSGMSMFFSAKKICLNKKNILQFYKKRLLKILKVYLLFCLPYFVFMYLIYTKNLELFLKQFLFINDRVSSFWFLLIISICYLIYPIIYFCILNKKEKYVILGTVLYIIFLTIFCFVNKNAYMYYEILLSRIPIFVFGALIGKKVYDKKNINVMVLSIFLMGLISRGPIFYALNHINSFSLIENVPYRLYMGVLAVGTIFLAVILIPYFEKTKLNVILSFIGTITLEIYVVHIALRNILLTVFNIKLVSQSEILCFMILYLLSSILLGYGLHNLLKLQFRPNFLLLKRK